MKKISSKDLKSIQGGQNITSRATNWEDVLLRDSTFNNRATDWENVLLR